ncbi:Putative Mn2+ efflux pump MntP [Clostridium sp. DSM 8431]|uniref:manganese efflux pump MntP n=1 Tax=Clostridium sp. DSM 8431 TaxID=1761781 RepID=UPI0008EF99F9|nr:manganese efflux pump [Clostridium sp. DSM 8431]SFU76282.1 Putative Mn2+ efflux pump MntP [Clostridium sp. DSM 8431]
MSIFKVFLIGIALAMDAFGVSLSVGVTDGIKRKQKILYIMSFAFFQFLLIFLGAVAGRYVNTYLVPISNTFGGIAVGIIGVLMIIDGLKEREESILTKNSMILILGISVSIDAIVVGFTTFIGIQGILLLFVESIFVGLITLFMCTLAFFICRYIKKISFVKKYANLLGGIALIIFSINMIFF